MLTIEEVAKNIPCGHCGEPLPETPLYRFMRVNALGDIPKAVQGGTINSATCTVCGYVGWFWPGFLFVVRQPLKAIFVSARVKVVVASVMQPLAEYVCCEARQPRLHPAQG